ncbi:MAG: undecaprenyl-diphosphatase [Nitrospirae bacterium RIFOXYB2_FULL_43_5]|nr:MAG: undecaprenyl-diphosphatase [Nitrospirae bacterium RIFOXYB2_FULL_43_5]
MDIIVLVKAAVMGIVEGLTEFLPISSTGHMILAGNFISFTGEKAKLFEVFIQLGAKLAIVWVYKDRILTLCRNLPKDKGVQGFALKILVAFMPAAIVGLATHKLIKQYLFGPVTVSFALVVGGLIILLIEAMKHSDEAQEMESLTYRMALWVGIAQVLALFPGVSRSGATIMGGIVAGMSRKASTEFSFFLAIPTMFAATIFDFAKSAGSLTGSDIGMLGVGFVFAFFSAIWVVKWLIKFVSTNNFRPFAYYRIVFGGVLLVYYLTHRG